MEYMEPGKIIKSFKSKKGNDVVFRSHRKDDLDGMLAFINALIAEDTYIEMCGKPLTREEEEKTLTEALIQIEQGKKVWVVVEINGKYSGSGEIRIGSRRHTGVGEIGISIAREYREEGIGTILLETLIEIAKQKHLRLLVLSCFENNTRACHVYQKFGFIKSGVVPGAISFKNEYVGEVKFYLPLV